ncbi:MAG: hypothetical protein HFJ27_01225 [Clostridia bacterium]|nr:hypothetical protein [Clostridia bacterium]
MNTKKTKNVKWHISTGITLLSLVLTVVILLILAGIVINFTLGEQGIFNRTTTAKQEAEIKNYKEQIEIARIDISKKNKGTVTLKDLINEIYARNIVPEGNIEIQLDEESAKVITVEGYEIIITGDKEDERGKLIIAHSPKNWTNGNVTITIKNNVMGNDTVQYSLDEKTWFDYNEPFEVSENITVYACLVNEKGNRSSISSRKIANIDKSKPEQFVPKITKTSKSIAIDAKQAKDTEATDKYGKSGIKEIWYSIDGGASWQTNINRIITNYTFQNLPQNTTNIVQVKVIDNAGNETITQAQSVTTDSVMVATGNITVSEPVWNSQKAKVILTKKDTLPEELEVQYQINTYDEDKWETGTIVLNINHNDTIYARLWDGVNGGSYISSKIVDNKPPKVTLERWNRTTNSIEVRASSQDAEYGMPTTPNYVFYIKKDSEPDSAYQQKQSGSSRYCTFTGLTQNTNYTLKVTTQDKAGNIGIATITSFTKDIDSASGNVSISAPNWDSTTNRASVTITKKSYSSIRDFEVQYQVNGYAAGGWKTGTTVTNLHHNDTVYVRLWDGVSGGNYASSKIVDSKPPTVTVNISNVRTNSFTATATSSDTQYGMPSAPNYVFYIKKYGEPDSAYQQKQSGTSAVCTYTGLAQNTGYIVKVTTQDKAGNIGEATKSQYTAIKPNSPNIQIVGGAQLPNGVYRTGVTIKITYSGGSRTTYWLSGATSLGETTISNGGTFTISNDGTTTIQARTYDSAGNYSDTTTISITKATVVAAIGSNYYATLQNALNAVGEGEEIDLLTNVSEDVWAPQNRNFTLDMNGNTLTGSINVNMFCGMQIWNGSIISYGKTSIYSYGLLNLYNVNINNYAQSASGVTGIYLDGGTVVLHSGVITQYDLGGDRNATAVTVGVGGRFEMKSGKIQHLSDDARNYDNTGPALRLNGERRSTDPLAKAAISGGEIYSKYGCAIGNSLGKVYIVNTTVTSGSTIKGQATIRNFSGWSDAEGGTWTILSTGAVVRNTAGGYAMYNNQGTEKIEQISNATIIGTVGT